jgi:hypothetical protein
MSDRKVFTLVNLNSRDEARTAVREAPLGHVCEIRPAKRSLSQNDKFRAICRDIAKSGYELRGNKYDEEDWHDFLVSAHATATGRRGRMELGLEGERVFLREKTSQMDKGRMSSLIEHTQAWCAQHGVKLKDEA